MCCTGRWLHVTPNLGMFGKQKSLASEECPATCTQCSTSEGCVMSRSQPCNSTSGPPSSHLWIQTAFITTTLLPHYSSITHQLVICNSNKLHWKLTSPLTSFPDTCMCSLLQDSPLVHSLLPFPHTDLIQESEFSRMGGGLSWFANYHTVTSYPMFCLYVCRWSTWITI
jgi:hypothetical protein